MKTIRYIAPLIVMLFATTAMAQEIDGRRLFSSSIRGKARNVVVKVDVPPVSAPTKGHYTFGIVVDGDTMPYYKLPEVTVYASGMLLTPKEIKQNAKLIRNVRAMLPYAQEGRRRLDALEVQIAALPKRDRKAAIKEAEAQLLADYKDEISKYTFSQGLVLIKLIDRETNRTAYTIVGELRGSIRAGLYQTVAKVFGYNLKDTFDPKHNKKDDLIDRICVSIERGQI